MPGLKISKASSAKDSEPITMAVHHLIGLPVAMRSVNKKDIVTGVIINQPGKKIDLPDLFRSYPDIAREVRDCLDKYFK
ncbi:MAG: hypothetical protein AEth_00003 [Candidatus Argoarchaeum ethanivorans]|uniref:Uncharacterized protein n=1 Tax=Candidatus Argoarchaeum ethanivorans TaxID=2608793 RepID=A0A8B3SBA5_9EURY|nr:MAG: hypothetical protein AEth_00003 [Candidatus Argoarchaeum ethanivorans]